MSDPELLSALARDLEQVAALVGAVADPEQIRRTLATFAVGFGSCPIELRTTSLKPGASTRELSFRYIDADGSHDPYQLARDAGLIAQADRPPDRPPDRPIDRLMPELRRRFPIFGHGVDASTRVGFEKLWPFFDRPYPLAALAALDSLPPAVARAAPLLERHGLDQVATVAADFRHATANLYFPRPGFGAGPRRLAALLDALGWPVPPADELGYFSRAAIVGVTVSWTSDQIERLCCYVPVAAGDTPWLPDDPVLHRLVVAAPVRTEPRRFVVGGTYGAAGGYTKLEIDYARDSVALMERWLERLARKAGPGPSTEAS